MINIFLSDVICFGSSKGGETRVRVPYYGEGGETFHTVYAHTVYAPTILKSHHIWAHCTMGFTIMHSIFT